jgi:hypothetical protein
MRDAGGEDALLVAVGDAEHCSRSTASRAWRATDSAAPKQRS